MKTPRSLPPRTHPVHNLAEQLVASTVHCALFSTDLEGTITSWNPGAERLFGHASGAATGRPLQELITPVRVDAESPWARELQSVQQGNASARQILLRVSNGREVWVGAEFSPLLDSNAKVIGAIVLMRDTGREHLTRQTLDAIIDSAAYAIIATSPSGTVTIFNRAAEVLTGYTADEMVNKQSPAAFHVPEEVVARAATLSEELGVEIKPGFDVFTEQTVRTRAPDERQWTYVRKSGQPVPVLLSITALRDPNDEVIGYLGIARDLSELAASQQQVEQQEALRKVVFSASLDPMFVIDEKGTVRDATPATERVLGWKPEQLIGSNIKKIVPPEIAAHHDGYLQRYKATGKRKIIGVGREVEALRADGTRIPVDLSIVEAEANGQKLYLGTVHDISVHKDQEQQQAQAHQQVERGKKQLDDALAVLDAGLVMYDPEGRLLTCNNQFVRLLGLPPGLAVGGAQLSEIAQAAGHLNPAALGYTQKGGALSTEPHSQMARVGERFLRCDIQRTPDGGIVALYTDVTSVKAAEASLKAQEQRLQLAADTAELGIWRLDGETFEMTWDTPLAIIHGLGDADGSQSLQQWLDSLHSEDRDATEEHLLGCMSRGTVFQCKYRVLHPSGEVRVVDARSDYIHDMASSKPHLLTVCRDVTEEERHAEHLEQAVVAAELATRAKADFLATMSHEIRTPMNGVIGMASLLVGTALDPKQREYAETIRSSGESLLALINDILDFSKIEAGKLALELTDFCLDETISQSLNLFTDAADNKGVRLHYDRQWSVRVLRGDPTRLRQILLNLVSNALKFTADGEVCVRVETNALNEQRVQLVLTVSDTGIGMSAEHLARLGEAFVQADASTTRKFGGTGLGMSICIGLIERMGGTMEVESTLGEGTCFVVRLPIERGNLQDREATQELSSEGRSQLTRVLVVEDNFVNQRVVTAMLKPYAQSVEVAENGRIGYDQFCQQRYDLVLMDGQMPELDGIGATRLIRQLESEEGRAPTPIVALTANALPGDREQYLEAGMNDYLAKPIRREDLKRLLDRLGLG